MHRSLHIVAALLIVALPAAAQQKPQMPGMAMPEKKAPEMDMTEVTSKAPYHPGLGELMIAFVQPRHVKLGLAGAAKNWPCAAYELDELRETFDDVGRLVIKHGKLDIAPAIASTVKPPMEALDQAIKAQDPAAFAKSYGDLTAGCNACHQSGDHPMIVIKVPDAGAAAAFPDQDFSPPK